MKSLKLTPTLRALAIVTAAFASVALIPSVAHAAADAPDTNSEQISLVVERQSDVFMAFDLRQDGAVVAAPGFASSFTDAADRAATVTAPVVGATGKVVFENGKCLQAFGPNGNGWTIVSNDCAADRTLWERTDAGALRIVGTPARALEHFGNVNTITKRAVTGHELPVGVSAVR